MCKGNAERGRGNGRLCLLGVSEASPGKDIVQRGNYWGNRGHNDSVWGKGKVRYAHGTEDSDLPGAGWLSSGELFDLFQMSQEEEDVVVLSLEDSEYFDTAEAGSSADEMDDCLSVVSEVEGLAVAEATGTKMSKMPAGAEAPGSDDLMDSPARRKKNKGRSRYGPGRAERRKRQAISRQESEKGSLPGEAEGEPESSGNSSGVGCPMEGCGKWVTDLRGHCVQAHIPEVFRDLGRTGQDLGRVRASALQTTLRVLVGSGGDLFVTRQDC